MKRTNVLYIFACSSRFDAKSSRHLPLLEILKEYGKEGMMSMARWDEMRRRRIQNPIPEKEGEYSMSSSCICYSKDCLFIRRHIRQMPIKTLAVPQITFPVSPGKKLEASDRSSRRRRREREISPLSIAQRRKGGFTFEKRSFLVGGHIFLEAFF